MPVANRQLLKDFGKQYNRLALHGSSQGVCCREMGFCSDQKSYVRDVTVAIPAHEGRDAWSMSRSAMWALEGHLALVFKGHWLTVNSFSLPYRSLSSHSRNLLWFTGNVLPDISSPKFITKNIYVSSATMDIYQTVASASLCCVAGTTLSCLFPEIKKSFIFFLRSDIRLQRELNIACISFSG